MHDMLHSSQISSQRSASADRSPKGPQYLEARNAGSRKDMIAFSKLPSTAIYWHVKQWRGNAIICKQKAAGMNPNPEQIAKLAAEGPEDWVAECGYHPLAGGAAELTTGSGVIVSGCIQEKHRSRLMLEASIKMFFREMNLESVAEMGLGREISDYTILDKEMGLFKQWGKQPEYLPFGTRVNFQQGEYQVLVCESLRSTAFTIDR